MHNLLEYRKQSFFIKNILLVLMIIYLAGCGSNQDSEQFELTIIRVPSDYLTIQGAIDNSKDTDIIVINNGTYYENLTIEYKQITLTSNYYFSKDKNDINSTTIDGSGNTVITIDTNSTNTSINGLTIQNGNDGISPHSKVNITNNIIKNNIDGIDYEGGGGTCLNNTIINNVDDAIDLDGSVEVKIENNNLSYNGDDGIEIRLHPHEGTTLIIDIINNKITHNKEDGIQLIGYNELTKRKFKIYRNLITDISMSAIGFMDNQNTIEDYSGASLNEETIISNNTFVNNNYCVTGGSNSLIINNVFLSTINSTIKNVLNGSLIHNNLYWNNGLNLDNSNFDSSFINYDPLLNTDYSLMQTSPAIDIGINSIEWNNYNFSIVENYNGTTSDIGFLEYE
jgi:hypothetical protein